MNTYYALRPTNSDILHFGKGHDDNPPGRGSGRFPFGSGKRPKQHTEPAKPKDKEAILKSANPHEILSIKDDLTNNELNAAINRIEAIHKLESYDKSEIANIWRRINNISNSLNDVYRWANTGKRIWNVCAIALKLPKIP